MSLTHVSSAIASTRGLPLPLPYRCSVPLNLSSYLPTTKKPPLTHKYYICPLRPLLTLLLPQTGSIHRDVLQQAEQDVQRDVLQQAEQDVHRDVLQQAEQDVHRDVLRRW